MAFMTPSGKEGEPTGICMIKMTILVRNIEEVEEELQVGSEYSQNRRQELQLKI
jgi:hypothetical protein